MVKQLVRTKKCDESLDVASVVSFPFSSHFVGVSKEGGGDVRATLSRREFLAAGSSV